MIDLTAIQAAEKDLGELHDTWAKWVPENGSHAHKLLQAVGTALAALRECAERREGCVFCGEKRHHIREAFDDGTAQIIEAMNNYALSIKTPMDATTSSVFPIHYCPMCGRKLERSDT